MSSKAFSNTRTKSTWKPRVNDADLPFYERVCRNGNTDAQKEAEGQHEFFLGLGTNEAAFLSEPGRNPVFNLPYASPEYASPESNAGELLFNHSEFAHSAALISLEDLPEGISLNYSIVGGYNNNAIEVSWSIDAPTYRLQWIALKTFTGMQLKYLTPKKKAPVIFALADEDAYVYCDENPCLECVFMCKRGFVIYANVAGLGIVKFPLTRASAYWQSQD